MTEMIKVKPAAGRDTLMENGREWPQSGAIVEKTLYIRRRLAAGDLIAMPVKTKSDTVSPLKGDK